MSDNTRKCMVICLLALFIALIGIVLPEQEDTAFLTVVNNTDLSIYGTGERLSNTTYYANNSEIQILLIGNSTTDDDISMNLSVEGIVVQSEHLLNLPSSNPQRNISISMNIPKGASYMVTNHSRTHVSWREYPILTGRNGTLSINQTGGPGSQNLSQVLDQGNQAKNQSINFTNAGKWLTIGYVSSDSVMALTTSNIFYFRQSPASYLGYMGQGYAYSAYDNRAMKFGTAGDNASKIFYNGTHGTTWSGMGNLANRLTITAFDSVNMHQDLNLTNHNLTGCLNCGGNQNLSQVLAVGNNATNQNITNLNLINNVFQVNTSSKAVRLNYNTTDASDSLYTQILYNSPSTYSLNLISYRAIGNSSYPYFLFGSANGNETNILPPLTNKILVNLAGQGYYNAWTTTRSLINYVASEDWTSTAQGTKMSFWTTSNGTTTLTERMQINDSGKLFLNNLRGDDNSGNAYLCINKSTNEVYIGNPTC